VTIPLYYGRRSAQWRCGLAEYAAARQPCGGQSRLSVLTDFIRAAVMALYLALKSVRKPDVAGHRVGGAICR
jgi:hypothetical protein